MKNQWHPIEITNLARELVMPPTDSADVCPICRSWRNPDYLRCWNCEQATRALGILSRVVPISMYRKPSAFRDWLKYYKTGAERHLPEYGSKLAAILRRSTFERNHFLREHYGDWTSVCVVPSSWRVTPAHPLEGVLSEAQCDWGAPVRPMLRYRGSPLAHGDYRKDCFEVTSDVRNHRILLLDDVYTSGAHAQGASSSLRAHGAEVTCILVIGRRINPEFAGFAAKVWTRQQLVSFDFGAPYWT